MAICIIGCSASPAMAFLDDEPATTDTAYTLSAGQFRVSAFSADYGLFDSFQIGTAHLANVFALYNGNIKWGYWHNESVALSARLELVYLDLERWPFNVDQPSRFVVVPFELAGSWRFAQEWSLHGSALFSKVSLSGMAEDELLRGAAGVDNLQSVVALHWQWSRKYAWYVRARLLVFQRASGTVNATIQIDDKTTAQLVAQGESDAVDYGGAGSLVLGAIFAGDVCNLRAGIGYGNWSLPIINFVVPERHFILDLDLYFRF